ncbi:MAG: hypothetical protein HZC36_02580 [Armatimonadetes bacterium]|nr:hypothetical protein [Armatimonadota bacterium]
MPHLHLTTSADLVENVDVPDILEALVKEFSGIESIKPEAVKAYHTLQNTWVMGKGAPPGFAHLEVKLLSGRSPALLQELSDRLYAELRKGFAGSLESGEVSLTLEVTEMSAATYRK